MLGHRRVRCTTATHVSTDTPNNSRPRIRPNLQISTSARVAGSALEDGLFGQLEVFGNRSPLGCDPKSHPSKTTLDARLFDRVLFSPRPVNNLCVLCEEPNFSSHQHTVCRASRQVCTAVFCFARPRICPSVVIVRK